MTDMRHGTQASLRAAEFTWGRINSTPSACRQRRQSLLLLRRANATATATPSTLTSTPAPSSTPTAAVTPTVTLTPGQITLSARGYKVQGRHTVDLTRSGATSSNLDTYKTERASSPSRTIAPIPISPAGMAMLHIPIEYTMRAPKPVVIRRR